MLIEKMSQPTRDQLKKEATEQFVKEFWAMLPVERKFEILKAFYGNLVDDDFQTWLENHQDEISS